MPTEETLLERLATFAWFASNGEIALTAGLAFCLNKDSAASQTFIELIRRHARLGDEEPTTNVSWSTEVATDRGGRVDIVGFSEDGGDRVPTIALEAKIGAQFAPNQISDYLAYQRDRLSRAGHELGFMVVLVPAERIESAEMEVAKQLGEGAAGYLNSEARSGSEPRIAMLVISWEDLLSQITEKAGSARSDLQQLAGACKALRGADVPAITQEELDKGWAHRADDLRSIIDRVTRVAGSELSLPLYPIQPNSRGGLEGGYRYLGVGRSPHLTVGMRAQESTTPLWARWHRETPDVERVATRLRAAGFEPGEHDGHLWQSLEIVPAEGSALSQIEDLANQVVRLYRVSLGEPTSSSPARIEY